MILVRNVFKLKFGKAREALALWKEGARFIRQSGAGSVRVCTDLTGPYYTLVVESTHASLAEFEKMRPSAADEANWKKWYEKFIPLVKSGGREIFNIVE